MSVSLALAAILGMAGDPPVGAPALTAANPEAKVCKTLKVTGSRAGGKRYCATAAEWKQLERQAEDDTGEVTQGVKRLRDPLLPLGNGPGSR